MSNWRAAAQMVLAGGGGFPEVSKTITSGNLPAENRMVAGVDEGAGLPSEVNSVLGVYSVSNPVLRIKTFSENILPIVENNKEIDSHQYADFREQINAPTKTPNKLPKPPKPVNSVSEVNSVLGSALISRSIVVAVRTGDPTKIAAAVAADPDLSERAAIRQYDGGMRKLDADLATLLDMIDEAGYVL